MEEWAGAVRLPALPAELLFHVCQFLTVTDLCRLGTRTKKTNSKCLTTKGEAGGVCRALREVASAGSLWRQHYVQRYTLIALSACRPTISAGTPTQARLPSRLPLRSTDRTCYQGTRNEQQQRHDRGSKGSLRVGRWSADGATATTHSTPSKVSHVCCPP
jgi:hypothetical protein